MKQEITTYIFGEMPIWKVWTNLFIGGFGLLMPYMYWAMKRDPHKGNTPVKFSIKVFLTQNILSIVSRLFFLGIFLIVLCPYYKIDISPALALIIGAGLPFVVSRFMDNLPIILKNLLPSINNKNTTMSEELDYYFPIPDLATGVVFNGKPISFDQFCALQPAIMDSLDGANAIRLQTVEPEQLEFVLSTGNEFVGHVPKPRKPW